MMNYLKEHNLKDINIEIPYKLVIRLSKFINNVDVISDSVD